MKINKDISVNITQQGIYNTTYSYNCSSTCFKVTFTTKYVLKIGNNEYILKTNVREVPFLFPTFETAKDFCTINPKIESVYFANTENCYIVEYKTYRLKKNRKTIGYVVWDRYFINENNVEGKIFSPDKFDPIIYGFAKDIELKNWVCTHSLSDIKTVGFSQFLSKVPETIGSNRTIYNQWNFKLVEENEEK